MYHIFIYLFAGVLRVLALFNKKIAKMRSGQQEAFGKLQRCIDPKKRYIWFHASSLGEFEQGRPLLEAIRAKYPHYGIVQTFFSPSGYEVRKDFKGADIVCYLPIDTLGNARRFLDLVRPTQAFFIKYEFWKNYLDELRKRNVPVYSVSSIFRPSQIFFRWYGWRYRMVLKNFDYLFVQNEDSKRLLSTIDITNVKVTGDTRFDRVLDILTQSKHLPVVEAFAHGATVLVAGSTWAPDEEVLLSYFNEHPDLKLVLAPHVVDEAHIADILSKTKGRAVRYSQATETTAADAQVLIIDGYGMLSSIYRYGQVAYVGGGFGVGIHNVLEAAVYSIPVIFGTNYQRFQEAVSLIEQGGAFSVADKEAFHALYTRFLSDPAFRTSAGETAGHYVSMQAGVVDRILEVISPRL